MNLDKIFGLSKQAHDVPMGVASTHRYDDQRGTPAELRLVDPTAWEKFGGLGVSLRHVFGFDKAAAPVMAPGLLKRLSATLKGGKVAK